MKKTIAIIIALNSIVITNSPLLAHDNCPQNGQQISINTSLIRYVQLNNQSGFLNVRNQPSIGAEIRETLPHHSEVVLYDLGASGWVLITHYKKPGETQWTPFQGYIKTQFLIRGAG